MTDPAIGFPAVTIDNLPSAINISSSTNASPIVIHTATPHGLLPGEYFIVLNADDNALNGVVWMAGTVTSTSVVVLEQPSGDPSVGTMSGGANGTVQSAGFGTTVPLLTDNDPPSATLWNVIYQALLNYTAYLLYVVQYALTIATGGKLILKAGSTLQADNGSSILLNGNVTAQSLGRMVGTWKWESGASVDILPGAALTVEGSAEWTNASSLTQDAGALWNLHGVTVIKDSTAFLEIQDDSELWIDGTSGHSAIFRVKSHGRALAENAKGIEFTAAYPAVTADPGANVAIGANQCKSWGALLSDGAGNVTCPRGMNVASVAISASGAGWQVLFHASRPMDSNDYSLVPGYRVMPSGPAGIWIPQIKLQSSLGFTIDLYKPDGTPADVANEIHGCGFQIEAKQ